VTGRLCLKLAWPSCVVGGLRLDCSTPAPCACASECEEDGFLELDYCYNVTAPASMRELAAAPLVPFPRMQPVAQPAVKRLADPAVCSSEANCSSAGWCDEGLRCHCFQQLGTPDQPALAVSAKHGERCENDFRSHPPGGPSELCIVPDCNGHGRCVDGVCVCTGVRHGAACEFPEPRAEPVAERRSPRVYVYTLPPGFNVYQTNTHTDLNIAWHIWGALLRRDCPYRTHDPGEADFFFVPAVTTYLSDNSGSFFRALHYVRTRFPFWNASGGTNHIVVGGWDFGLSALAAAPHFQRLRVLSYFGVRDSSAPWQATADGRCRKFGYEGPDCRPVGPILGPLYGPHRPGVDIILPYYDRRLARLDLSALPASRNVSVYFGGGMTSLWREEIVRLHKDTPGWSVYDGKSQGFPADFLTARVCLDLPGSGYSTRFSLAVVLGCVPAYLDELVMPWEGFLPLQDFSIRFSRADVPRLPALIAAATANGGLERLQAGVLRHRRAYHWESFYGPAMEGAEGSHAFDFLMHALKQRSTV